MDLAPPTWILIAFIAYFAFALGRATKGTGPRETREERAASTAANMARLTGAARAEVERLLDERRKIDAVKACREALGTGLRDSKDVVDALCEQRRAFGG